jgi:hypothetical protein
MLGTRTDKVFRVLLEDGGLVDIEAGFGFRRFKLILLREERYQSRELRVKIANADPLSTM